MRETLDVIPIITRQEQEIISKKIIPRLSNMYAHLEIPLTEISEVVHETIELSKGDRKIEDIERDLRKYLEQKSAFLYFDDKMNVRALMWYQKISPHLKPETRSLLDLGGGDGRTSKRIQDEYRNYGKDISVIVSDILDYPDRIRGLPYTKMQHTETPFANDLFDSVFVVTVYHHVGIELDDCLKLIDETVRVSKNQAIVIESIYKTEPERLYTMWIDWFYNRVLHYAENQKQKVNVPFNFRKPEEWKEVFEDRAITVKDYDLQTFQILNPEHHWLYVIEK